MTRKTTGISHRLTAPRRPPPAIRGFLLSALIVCVLASVRAGEVYGQQALLCGMPGQESLDSGSTDSYLISALQNEAVLVEAIDTTGTIGTIELRVSDQLFACGGTLVIPPGTAKSMITASNCRDQNSGNYTISMAVVSEGPDNCGVPLPCNTALQGPGVELKVPGEVDSYTFPGVQGDTVRLTVADVARMIGAIRLRVFDPNGGLVTPGGDSCTSAIGIKLPLTGTYTVLVSACTTHPQTGPYAITLGQDTCPVTPPPGQLAYLPNADSATVSVVELAKDTTAAIIPIASPDLAVIGTATAVAMSPTGGFAYVTYGNSSTLSVINTSTNLITASIPVGLDAAGVAASPDGTSVCVLANDLSGIAVIDTKTKQVNLLNTSGTIGSAGSLEFTPDGTTLYVVSDELSSVIAFDPKTGDSNGEAAVGNLGVFDALAISPDGSMVYVGTLDGIAVIPTATNVPSATISLPNEPLGIAFSPDGTRAYASQPDAVAVAVIDTQMQMAIKTIPVGVGGPGALAVSPDGALVYVADSTAGPTDPGFFVIEAATARVINSAPVLGGGPAGMGLTSAPIGLCVGDAEGETKVTVDEIIGAVNDALNGCPGRFPTMSTLTR